MAREVADGQSNQSATINAQGWLELQKEKISRIALASKELSSSAISTFHIFEHASLRWVKEQVENAREYPGTVVGIASLSSLILLRGSRRFLFRHTLGRFQSEEALFTKAEKKVNELSLSSHLLKKEGQKLLQRSALAEKDMKVGLVELQDAGARMHTLIKSVYRAEDHASDLMDRLRRISGKDALRLRAEVASIASLMKNERIGLDKRIIKICDNGVPLS